MHVVCVKKYLGPKKIFMITKNYITTVGNLTNVFLAQLNLVRKKIWQNIENQSIQMKGPTLVICALLSSPQIQT